MKKIKIYTEEEFNKLPDTFEELTNVEIHGNIREFNKEIENVVFSLYGNIDCVRGGTITDVSGGNISGVYGGTITDVSRGNISGVYGGTITDVSGGKNY